MFPCPNLIKQGEVGNTKHTQEQDIQPKPEKNNGLCKVR